MKALILAAALAASLAPAAHAGSDSTHLGGCSYSSVGRAGQGWTPGELDVEAVVYSPTPEANPVWATITCYILVNGIPQPGAVITASGVAVVAGGGPIGYTSDGAWDNVQLCQRIDFTGPGDTTPTVEECFETAPVEFPPPWIDPPWLDLCPALTLAPGNYGPVLIESEGDVYITGELFWDCPPYDVE